MAPWQTHTCPLNLPVKQKISTCGSQRAALAQSHPCLEFLTNLSPSASPSSVLPFSPLRAFSHFFFYVFAASFLSASPNASSPMLHPLRSSGRIQVFPMPVRGLFLTVIISRNLKEIVFLAFGLSKVQRPVYQVLP